MQVNDQEMKRMRDQSERARTGALASGSRPARGYGALVDALLSDAFSVLQHDTGESDPEWHEQRAWLAEKFRKTLRTKKRHNAALCEVADKARPN